MKCRGVLLAAGSIVLLSSGAQALGDIRDWRTGDVIRGTEESILAPGQFFQVDAPFGDMRAAELYGTVWQGLNLSGAKFNGSNLTGSRFSHADLTGADFTGSSVYFVAFHDVGGLTAGQIASTANYASGSLVGVSLENVDLRSLDFTGFDLRGAMMESCNVNEVSFAGALVAGTSLPAIGSATGVTAATLYSTASYRDGNLEGVTLTGDLRGANFSGVNLSFARLSADVSGAHFQGADLHGATLAPGAAHSFAGVHFDGANVAGATFASVTTAGFREDNLYSTATWQGHGLKNVTFESNDLRGWDFSRQDLRGSQFYSNDLAATNFDGAQIDRATIIGDPGQGLTASQLRSTANYATGNLGGIVLGHADFHGVSFAGMNLTEAVFYATDLRDARFDGADIGGANFIGEWGSTGETNLTPRQLASTANYARRDLRRLRLGSADMRGADFSGQDLRHAFFEGVALAGTSFRGADLREATITWGGGPMADLSGADFSFADLRRGYFTFSAVRAPSATFRNTIESSGVIKGLSLMAGDTLTIRNDAQSVRVRDSLALAPGSILQLQFATESTYQPGVAASPWLSPITIDAGLSPTLAGTLLLTFAASENPYSFAAMSFDLFDWPRPLDPANQFDAVISDLPANLSWDISSLYTTGIVRLVTVPEPGAALALLLTTAITTRRRR